MSRRRERILSLATGFDTIIVLGQKNLFYLTDFWGGGIGVVERDRTTVFTSVMEEKRAMETSIEARVVSAKGQAALYAEAKARARGKVLLDQHGESLRGTVNGGLFLEARRKKDPEEVKRITVATKKVEALYELLETQVRPGRTEREIAGEVMRLATREGLAPLAAEGSLSPLIVASGPNGALPHAELSDRKLRKGDMVVADLFFRYRGYCTDCTRTYAVSSIPDRWRESYAAVLEAQLKGVSLVRTGASGKEIHGAVRGVLAEHGLADYFTHGTGHGVGIDIHERPSVGALSTDTLSTGDVVTVEPGVYIPGRYGIRIEDTLVVEERTRNLYTYTKDLLTLG